MLRRTFSVLALSCLMNCEVVHCDDTVSSSNPMAEFVTVEMAQGKLRGQKVISSESGATYYSFQGIPYAKPPLGPLRFKAPEDPEPWVGTRDALKEGDICVQKQLFSDEESGSEDCLVLNVYTPQLSTTLPKAVMVWIHGGKFNGGSGNTNMYGPDFLMVEDVVLVTINYRIGAMGFLYLEGADVTDNNGFRDQVMALKWVKKNIAYFGGDPDNVTIFGQSAGGSAVHYLMLAPQAAGLFHRAVAQSGTVFIGGTNQAPDIANRRAFRVAKVLGCTSEDPQQVADFLRTLSPEKFLGSRKLAQQGDELHATLFEAFLPVCAVGPDAFLPDTPRKLLESGQFTKVPLIAGITSSEAKGPGGMGPPVASRISRLDTEYESVIPIFMINEAGPENTKEIGSLLKKLYFSENQTNDESAMEFVNLMSDYDFVFPLHLSLKQHLRWSSQPTYVYMFDHKSAPGFGFRFGPTGGSEPDKYPGVGHTGELRYLFQSSHRPTFPPGSTDSNYREKMVKLWTNFAKTGNPTSDAVNITWTPATKEILRYLRINGGFNMEKDIFKKRMDFWDELYEKFIPKE